MKFQMMYPLLYTFVNANIASIRSLTITPGISVIMVSIRSEDKATTFKTCSHDTIKLECEIEDSIRINTHVYDADDQTGGTAIQVMSLESDSPLTSPCRLKK